MLNAARTAWVAVLLVGAALIGSDPSRSHPQAQQQPADPQTYRSNERQNNPKHQETSSWPQSFSITTPKPTENRGNRHAAQAEGESKQRNWLSDFLYEIRVTDVLLVLFTGLLVFFTGRLWHATAGLWASADAANKLTLENMTASRRAWVSIESVKLKHPTGFTDASAVFGIDVTIKNLGNTPATSVEVMMESYFDSGGKFLDAERRFKDKLREHHVQLGHLLFPNDTFRQGTIWADGSEKIQDRIMTLPSGERIIGFSVLVGISYRIIGDDKAHITYHAHQMLNVPIGTVVPADTFVDLPRMPFLAGEAD